MGREVKRVPVDFDWSLREMWPGNLIDLCGVMGTDCEKCHHFARLAGLPLNKCDCPDIARVPAGDGYQIWETVSEGSPITPVFATPEELATWCVENDTGEYGLAGPGPRPSYEDWLEFIQVTKWVPSGHITGGELINCIVRLEE